MDNQAFWHWQCCIRLFFLFLCLISRNVVLRLLAPFAQKGSEQKQGGHEVVLGHFQMKCSVFHVHCCFSFRSIAIFLNTPCEPTLLKCCFQTRASVSTSLGPWVKHTGDVVNARAIEKFPLFSFDLTDSLLLDVLKWCHRAKRPSWKAESGCNPT